MIVYVCVLANINGVLDGEICSVRFSCGVNEKPLLMSVML